MARVASDLMQTGVISVSPDDPLGVVQRLFFEEEIHGAPVLDEAGRVVGVISSADLLRAAAEDRDAARGSLAYLEELVDYAVGEFGDSGAPLSGRVVSDVMSTDVVSVAPKTPIWEVARLLRQGRIHRVLVLEEGRVCGIVSTLDLLAELEKREGA